MRNLFFKALLLTAVILSSCSAPRQTVDNNQKAATSPFGETFSMPCGEFRDTKEKFAGVGIYRGSYKQKNECHREALENAKGIIRAKFHHVYKGLISDYSSTIGNNRGNDIETKMQRAGDAIIDIILNDAYEVCTKFSAIDEEGHLECYVAIEIYKEEVANKVSKKVEDVLSKEEKKEINISEYTFRKQMNDRMSKFDEENN